MKIELNTACCTNNCFILNEHYFCLCNEESNKTLLVQAIQENCVFILFYCIVNLVDSPFQSFPPVRTRDLDSQSIYVMEMGEN